MRFVGRQRQLLPLTAFFVFRRPREEMPMFEPSQALSTWQEMRCQFAKVAVNNVGRGVVGLAALVDFSHAIESLCGTFVPDSDVCWLSVVDVPRGHFDLRWPRSLVWCELHRTTIKFHMPTIGGGTPLGGWDLSLPPARSHDLGRVLYYDTLFTD